MKKIIISLLVIFIIPFSAFSQADDADNSNDFSKWQIRFRVISVIPDAGMISMERKLRFQLP